MAPDKIFIEIENVPSEEKPPYTVDADLLDIAEKVKKILEKEESDESRAYQGDASIAGY